MSDRYARQVILDGFGATAQHKLQNAKVLIVGMGGLGVPVSQYLVGAGVGKVGMMDHDTISLSNLPRQVLYKTADVGLLKVDRAREYLSLLNPEVDIVTYNEKLSAANSHIITAYDVVVDCTDNIPTRYLIDDACKEQRKPWVYGALFRHEGQVSVFNYPGCPSYEDVFPDRKAKVSNCEDLGVLGPIPGIIGSYQALETIKVITGYNSSLAGKLLIIDTLSHEQSIIDLTPTSSESTSAKSVTDWVFISWQDFDQMDRSCAECIDVRTPVDFQNHHDERFLNIELAIIEEEPIDSKKELVLVCDSGSKAKMAAQLLLRKDPGFSIKIIKGGYNSHG